MSEPEDRVPFIAFNDDPIQRTVPPWRCGSMYIASFAAWTGVRAMFDRGGLPLCWRFRGHRGPHRESE